MNVRLRIVAVIAGLAVVAGWLVLGCSRADQPLNVLFICVDTLRHDRVGYVGYERDVIRKGLRSWASKGSVRILLPMEPPLPVILNPRGDTS